MEEERIFFVILSADAFIKFNLLSFFSNKIVFRIFSQIGFLIIYRIKLLKQVA